MIKRKELQKKSLAAVMAASMTMSLLPGTALADATSGVLADGTYESTAHVTRTAEDDEDENAWDEYDVNVKITVADGKFSNCLDRQQLSKILKDGISYRVQPERLMQ